MYTLGAITFGGVGVTAIDQLENVQIDHGLAHLKVKVAGSVDTEMIANLQQTPSFGFTASDLKVMLDFCGVNGKTIDAAVPDSELTTYWRKYEEGAIFDSGSAHVKGTINKGFMYLESLQGAIGQAATATYKIVVLSDGVNDPYVWERPVAYPALTPGANAIWTLGKAFANVNADADFVQGLQSWRFNTGIELGMKNEPGQTLPVAAWINSRDPTLEIACQDMSLIDDDESEKLGGSQGVAIDANGVRCFLHKAVEGAGLEAPTGNPVHIMVHVTKGVIFIPNVDGTPLESASMNVNIVPAKGSVESVIISTVKNIVVAA